MKVIPKSPKITEGIPARRFIMCLIGVAIFFGMNLYSAIAVNKPIPTPINTERAVT